MSRFPVYTRDNAGHVRYRGVECCHDKATLLQRHSALGQNPRKEGLFGWPHPAVTWYGSVGIGTV